MKSVRIFCSLVSLCCGMVFSLEATATTFTSKASSYYPANNKMEGGYKDRLGKRLYTLQAYLRGEAPYVSVAMDSNAFKYGTKLRIKEIEERYGKKIEFRVVDTGGAFRRKGTSRIDICTESRRATLNPLVNRHLTITTDQNSSFAPPSKVQVKTTPVSDRTKVSKSAPAAPEKSVEVSADLKFLVRTSLLDNREVLNSNPRDMNRFCPAYFQLNQQERADVWTEMILSMAQSSSQMNSRKLHVEERLRDSSGKMVISRGLLQISAESARNYRCDFSQSSDLNNDSTNIKCGIKIIQSLISRDDEIGSSTSHRGLARYWGSFNETRATSAIQSRTSSVASCKHSSRVASGNKPTGGRQ